MLGSPRHTAPAPQHGARGVHGGAGGCKPSLPDALGQLSLLLPSTETRVGTGTTIGGPSTTLHHIGAGPGPRTRAGAMVAPGSLSPGPPSAVGTRGMALPGILCSVSEKGDGSSRQPWDSCNKGKAWNPTASTAQPAGPACSGDAAGLSCPMSPGLRAAAQRPRGAPSPARHPLHRAGALGAGWKSAHTWLCYHPVLPQEPRMGTLTHGGTNLVQDHLLHSHDFGGPRDELIQDLVPAAHDGALQERGGERQRPALPGHGVSGLGGLQSGLHSPAPGHGDGGLSCLPSWAAPGMGWAQGWPQPPPLPLLQHPTRQHQRGAARGRLQRSGCRAP